MNEIIALAAKDLRMLLRDKAGFFFAFVFPVVYASFFGMIMSGMGGGGSSGIYVVVVDEDQTESSAAFVQQLSDLDALNVITTGRDEAQELVRRGKRSAMLVLPTGFGNAREQIFGNPPKVGLGIDPARAAETGMLQGILMGELFGDLQRVFTDPTAMAGQLDSTIDEVRNAEDIDPLTRTTLLTFLPALKTFMTKMPDMQSDDLNDGGEGANNAAGFMQPKIEKIDILPQRDGPQSAYEITLAQGAVWGIMGCAAGFGISLVVERTRGTLVRLRMAPISLWQVLAGKGVACFFTTMTVGIGLFVFAAIVFGVRPHSYAMLAIALVCVSFAFVGIMMLLAVMGKTEQAAGGIGWAILVVLAMIGGGMMPLAFMPAWMQDVAVISPIKWSILAMEGAMWRAFSPTEMLTPCLVLIGIGIGCFGVGARVFKATV